MKTRALSVAVAAMVFVGGFGVTAVADESAPILTVEQAVAYTLKSDTEYLNLLDTGVTNEQSRTDTLNSYYTNYDESNGAESWLKTYASLMQIETKIALQSTNEQTKKLSLQRSLTKYFMNIIKAENEYALAQSALKNTEADLKITETKSRLGMISQADYNAALANYQKTLSSLETNKTSIDSAYIELNRLMGKPLENRYTLALEFEYAELGEVDLEKHITTAISKSASIKQKKSDLEVAQYKRDQAWWLFTISASDISDLDMSITQTKRSLEDTKESLRTSIINAYNNIKGLEIRIAADRLELKKMYDQLAIKQTQLSLGKITRLEVDKYLQQIAESEESLRQQIYEHGLAVWEFNNTELL